MSMCPWPWLTRLLAERMRHERAALRRTSIVCARNSSVSFNASLSHKPRACNNRRGKRDATKGDALHAADCRHEEGPPILQGVVEPVLYTVEGRQVGRFTAEIEMAH
jgi:hypothetical protein